MENEPIDIESNVKDVTNKEDFESKQSHKWRGAVLLWIKKFIEFDSNKATEGYLKDPWVGPLGH